MVVATVIMVVVVGRCRGGFPWWWLGLFGAIVGLLGDCGSGFSWWWLSFFNYFL